MQSCSGARAAIRASRSVSGTVFAAALQLVPAVHPVLSRAAAHQDDGSQGAPARPVRTARASSDPRRRRPTRRSADHVATLFHRACRVEPGGDGTASDGGDVPEEPLRPVAAQDRHPLAGLQAEGDQTARGCADLVPVFLPRPFLPGPVPLGHQRGSVGAPASSFFEHCHDGFRHWILGEGTGLVP